MVNVPLLPERLAVASSLDHEEHAETAAQAVDWAVMPGLIWHDPRAEIKAGTTYRNCSVDQARVTAHRKFRIMVRRSLTMNRLSVHHERGG
jgi:hypothetical protein